MCLIWMLKMSNMKNIWGWQTQKKNCPQWETRLKTPLLPDSCCALHHSHNPSVLFISPVCFLSSYIDLAMSPYLYLFYIFSHLILHAQPYMHTYTHTQASEMRTSRAIGVESVDERRPIWDWMTEWLKEWRAKAVKPSVSLHHSRRQEPMLRCKSGSQSRSYRVRSTRIGIFTQMHSHNHYFDGIYGIRATNDKGHALELKSCQQVHCTINPVRFEDNLKSGFFSMSCNNYSKPVARVTLRGKISSANLKK